MENKLTIKKILKDVWVMKKSIYIYNFLLTTFNILKILLATYILKYIFDVIVIEIIDCYFGLWNYHFIDRSY